VEQSSLNTSSPISSFEKQLSKSQTPISPFGQIISLPYQEFPIPLK